jgi:ketosteroid isomerase-like protein
MSVMAEVDTFLEEMLPRQIEAEQALCRGEAGARKETWSQQDPVTLFGAAVAMRRGWDEVDETFSWLAGRFGEKTLERYDYELVAAGAGGDLAYTVGFEHKVFGTDDGPISHTLRVTHVYRREDGRWRIVHRHGDKPPEGLPLDVLR